MPASLNRARGSLSSRGSRIWTATSQVNSPASTFPCTSSRSGLMIFSRSRAGCSAPRFTKIWIKGRPGRARSFTGWMPRGVEPPHGITWIAEHLDGHLLLGAERRVHPHHRVVRGIIRDDGDRPSRAVSRIRLDNVPEDASRLVNSAGGAFRDAPSVIAEAVLPRLFRRLSIDNRQQIFNGHRAGELNPDSAPRVVALVGDRHLDGLPFRSVIIGTFREGWSLGRSPALQQDLAAQFDLRKLSLICASFRARKAAPVSRSIAVPAPARARGDPAGEPVEGYREAAVDVDGVPSQIGSTKPPSPAESHTAKRTQDLPFASNGIAKCFVPNG